MFILCFAVLWSLSILKPLLFVYFETESSPGGPGLTRAQCIAQASLKFAIPSTSPLVELQLCAQPIFSDLHPQHPRAARVICLCGIWILCGRRHGMPFFPQTVNHQ